MLLVDRETPLDMEDGLAANLLSELERTAALPAPDRATPLLEIGRGLVRDGANGQTTAVTQQVIEQILGVIQEGAGSGRERLELGELLGSLGDPRIRLPSDPSYWVSVATEAGTVVIGRYPVTNLEFANWVDSGGYTDRTVWTESGWAWLQTCEDPWPVRAGAAGSEPFVVPNQPVVGVTWHEALAYATSQGARLPWEAERVRVVRGREKRPYPWGAPFGEGNANTREEVLGRPCAVGLYPRDRTPEGVYDLAGNVAEWTADAVAPDERLIHPGAWDQPSMAAWAKAKTSETPDARSAGLGFRLARDEGEAS